ncbi:uncharacterized protein LOC110416573 [Herrania umbratica]|uniref:Uncharacterized protein LOC110416573 n=1 Tax=Herrania umbratica TaxID=108875 RepID=A0A6J1AAT8_9ROSI|nr:uncharacterized protein LOC110416573 [Herrania umbratica]
MIKLTPALTTALYFIKKIWDEWNIRGALMFSLLLQSFLTLVAPFRISTRRRPLIALIWCAYLIADAAANYAIGLITNSQRTQSNPSGLKGDSDLLAFWAPFLLLHLGCPDTITAFSLEDNELWLRHMLSLILQAIAALYVFIQSLPRNKLQVPTLLMLVAGIIKYAERICALFLASLDRFRDSMLQKPDPGPDYARLMKKYASMKEGNLPTRIITVQEPEKEVKETKQGKLDDLEVVHYAYHFFETFKGLVVDLMFSIHARKESRDFFLAREPVDALRVIEVELTFIYGVFYTKMKVMHSIVGYLFRFTAFGSVLAALGLFHFKANKNEYDPFNVKITYILLLGAIALEVVAFLMLIFSDWTFASIKSPVRSIILFPVAAIFRGFLAVKRRRWYDYKCMGVNFGALGTRILFRRWSESVSAHNFIRYCLHSSPSTIHEPSSCGNFSLRKKSTIKVAEFREKHLPQLLPNSVVRALQRIKKNNVVGKAIWFFCFIPRTITTKTSLKDFLDEIRYVSQEPLTKELWEFIFAELKAKSVFADSPEDAKRISSSRGEWALSISAESDYSNLMEFAGDQVEYDESLLLWHIATDICHYTDTDNWNDPDSKNRRFSKLLSDYMLYILVMRPTMMSNVAGIGKIRFQDTCAEAERLFQKTGLGPNQDRKACKEIYDVNTEVKPVYLKGDRSKSVLFDACRLAKELNKLGEKKWLLMSKVWVELLSYAATQCKASSHAQQISKGGELITFVWLLMAHLGLGHYFQTNTLAKLVPGK